MGDFGGLVLWIQDCSPSQWEEMVKHWRSQEFEIKFLTFKFFNMLKILFKYFLNIYYLFEYLLGYLPSEPEEPYSPEVYAHSRPRVYGQSCA